MPESTQALLERARSLLPELEIEHVQRNEEGLINDVLIVNRQWVFRFAKTEAYARILQDELKILDLIRPRLGVRVPDPLVRQAGCMVYPLLSGQTLSLKTVRAFSRPAQRRIAVQLGAFLYQLHSTPLAGLDWELPASRAPVRRQDWLELQAQANLRIAPLLQAYQLEWLADLFDGVLKDPLADRYQPALIHGDLASYHLLLDKVGQNLNGVIDFGMAGLGDPASDIGGLINIYGETFVQKMKPTYPGLEAFLPRARFYAQLWEIEWVLRGLESGESFWFTGHLGNARDISI